jgi:putative sulfotransferase
MLSNMLRDHPHILSLSEFFSMVTDYWARIPETFSSEPIDGQRLWAMVADIPPRINLGLRYGFSPETLYPCDAPTARFTALTGVPAILHTTLPHLSDDPDAIFDALGAEVNQWPAAPLGEQYARLFGWLETRFGKRLWVERSGTTFGMIGQILATFPEARLVHIVRDGRDVAISMQQHMGFRFGMAVFTLDQYLGVDPLESADRTHIDRVPPELRCFLPENFDVEALRKFQVPLALCGDFWSQQIVDGLEFLSPLPAERLLTLRYEDFFTAPGRQIDALAAFLGDEFIDDDWSARCAATVRPPRSSWHDLPEEDAARLTGACMPGFESLRPAGVFYEV